MEVILGLIARQLGSVIAGALVAKGYADMDTAQAVAGGALAAGAMGWSYIQKKRSGAL